MSEPRLPWRQVQKHDIPDSWKAAAESDRPFIPHQGELIIYDDRYDTPDGDSYETGTPVGLKIGDGYHNVEQLPFYGMYDIPTKLSQLENDANFISEDYVDAYFKRLNSDNVLRFYCIEDVTVVINGVSTIYPANSNVEVKFLASDVWEIVPTSENSIMALNAFPGALGTYYPWLEGVKQFSNILFDMNAEDMYSKWSQGNQSAYKVQYAQYLNCIFWSDNAYVSDVSKRTNYTLYYTSQLPLCYSTIPDNTFKAFYLAFNVTSDPNWGNKAYRDSFAKATWATQVFSYYGARTIGIFGHDDPDFNIVLPKDCRGLMSAATAIENAGTFDAINVTNFGAKSGSWRDAFGWCNSLRQLYIKNLKVNLNLSWSPIDYESIYFIISTAANTDKITISLSPYTYNLLSASDFELASSKNIAIELITTNYIEDKRLSAIALKGDGTKVLSNDGTYKLLPTKTSDLANDSEFVSTADVAAGYVQKVAGKELSSNDFTDELKEKLEALELTATYHTDITLNASNWNTLTDEESMMTYYSQDISLSNISEYTKVELCPTFGQLLYMTKKNISFSVVTEEDSCIAYCFNNKPDTTLTIKAMVSEKLDSIPV